MHGSYRQHWSSLVPRAWLLPPSGLSFVSHVLGMWENSPRISPGAAHTLLSWGAWMALVRP